MKQLISEKRGSLIRALFRTGLAVGVAFGLQLTGHQVATLMAFVEVCLQLGIRWNEKG